MYRVKVATNSSRIWHNHFRKLMTSFFYPCKNKLNSLLVIKSLNCLISLNWLNLCYYICKNATHVVNNYDWFLSIYKRSLSTKLWEEVIPFLSFQLQSGKLYYNDGIYIWHQRKLCLAFVSFPLNIFAIKLMDWHFLYKTVRNVEVKQLCV